MIEVFENALPETWIERKTAVDAIEPIEDTHDALRDAAVRYISVLNAFSDKIEAVLSNKRATMRDVAIAYYSTALALGLNSVNGRSFTEIADAWGLERATLSKAAVAFVGANGLQPSFAMKRAETASVYAGARLQSIERNNGALPDVPAAGRSV
jgi:hypothetical protein